MSSDQLRDEDAQLALMIAHFDAAEPEQSPQTKAMIGRLYAIRYALRTEVKP